ncbi:5-methylcytosine rRNA methyltransferase NSUN4 [Frankliniella fusca]|uniref:NOL1/NOP2/Sun domain family member 4 n=1 Tax=Frankliniella fusca TaxID=407009 RepID=A0AAE1GY08_9NEOP|nr:5-methylcytosine rRNA methyltransferase NSUN4 [Frankliniella fusca]
MLRHTFLSSSLKMYSRDLLYIPKRWNKKYKEKRLEKLRNHNKALAQLDDFYGSVYKDSWPSIRIALLSEEKKGVVVNNFSDKERIQKYLMSIGAYNLRKIFNTEVKIMNESGGKQKQHREMSSNIYQIDGSIEEALLRQKQSEMADIYPEPVDSKIIENTYQSLTEKHNEDVVDDSKEGSGSRDPTQDTPLAESLKSADYDTARIILPGPTGIALSASLYDFVPTSKLKGLDDFIPESTHYKYYKDVPEAPYDLEIEEVPQFPDHLDVYAFERGNCDTFEYSRRGSTEVFDYHILRLGYLAPVLALDLKNGENVLDMTGSNLDIPMLICQTLTPGLFVINCGATRRGKYFLRYLESFIYDSVEESCKFVVTDDHPFAIEDAGMYDKIIVTVPSTFDRKAVTDDENNMFSPSLIKERLKLPEAQTAVLSKALELVKEGGSVVYCTETLSPIQNDAVVQRALEAQWTKSNTKFTIRDLSRAMEPLQSFLKIVPAKYGQLVTPFLPNNCGPLYFSKLVKNLNQGNSE